MGCFLLQHIQLPGRGGQNEVTPDQLSSSAHVAGALELHGLELIVWDGMIGGNFVRNLNLGFFFIFLAHLHI